MAYLRKQLDPGASKLISAMPRSLRLMAFSVVGKAWLSKLESLRHTPSIEGYSLVGFDRLRCIFIHIPKCAGVSFAEALFGNLGGGHVTAKQYIYLYGGQEFDKRFKFTVVRDPLDRLVSAFNFLKSGGMSDLDKVFADAHLRDVSTVEKFVTECLRRPEVGRFIHFKPQVSWLKDPRDGSLAVDFIARFERLAADFDAIAQRLESGSVLPVLNAGKSRAPDVGLSDAARSIVFEHYAEDYRAFNYSPLESRI